MVYSCIQNALEAIHYNDHEILIYYFYILVDVDTVLEVSPFL